MLIIGSAQAVKIVISIVRMKLLAVFLGPAGLGLLGIYNSLKTMASTAEGLRIAASGVRDIASVKGEEEALSRVRVVLLAAHLIQGVIRTHSISPCNWRIQAPDCPQEIGTEGRLPARLARINASAGWQIRSIK